MGKKRRQLDANVDGSEESTESGEGNNKVLECKHFPKAIELNIIRKKVKCDQFTNDCIGCKKKGIVLDDDEDELLNEFQPLWICLKCMHIACGRQQKSHAKEHCETPRSDIHCIVTDTLRWSLWCYKCDEDVTNNLNALNKKKLQEITTLLKNWTQVKSTNPLKFNISSGSNIICQNTASIDSEKKLITNNFPKVGGLINLGNTCFFNAVLQCLAQTPYLIKVLDDLQVSEQKFILPGGKFKGTDDEEIEFPPIKGLLEKTDTFIPVLRKTLEEMQNSEGIVYKPNELLGALRKKTMQCTDGGQHDSHELLRHLLEFVRNEDLRRYQAIILEEAGLSTKTKPQSVDNNQKSRVKFYGNQANAKFLGPDRVFRGELISTIQCLECKNSSIRTEPFLDLSLPVLIDKSLPSISKRRNSGLENSIDAMGNISTTTSKHELKKAHKTNNRKNRLNRKKNRENGNLSTCNVNLITEEKKGNTVESEESDADVEDNIENEEAVLPEVDINLSTGINEVSLVSDYMQQIPNDDNVNCNFASNATNVEIKGLMGNKKIEAEKLSISTSLVVPANFASPEGATLSPSSSPLTSKDSLTSPISSIVDGEDNEKVEKSFSREDSFEKLDFNNKQDLLQKTSDNLSDENLLLKKDQCSIEKKLTNGTADLISNVAKLELSSPYKSPTRYNTKEGECSIQQCLNQFTALELMDGNNKVGCTICTQRVNKGKKDGMKVICTDSTKQYLISRVPAVLILHLKRFQVQRFSFCKVKKHVSFPTILDLSPVSKDYTKPRIYALFGVVEHSGTLYGGHYVAYVKSRAPLQQNDPRWNFLPSNDGFECKETFCESNSEVERDKTEDATASSVEAPPGRWYYVSDSKVHEVDEKTVLSSEAYLLFYERIV